MVRLEASSEGGRLLDESAASAARSIQPRL
eukprot:SAG11_NODE_706_length_7651_cov_4.192399_6_plen_30_part_00